MQALHYSVVMKRKLSKKAKLSIFKTVFDPILTYGHAEPLPRGARGRAPHNGCLCPEFWFAQDTVFGTSRNDKTTAYDGKRNN